MQAVLKASSSIAIVNEKDEDNSKSPRTTGTGSVTSE
jgi:hypothetical protein